MKMNFLRQMSEDAVKPKDRGHYLPLQFSSPAEVQAVLLSSRLSDFGKSDSLLGD
jgi:hypothetical protein